MRNFIVVTGGTKGLGRAISETFANHGFDVCACARTQADLDEMRGHFNEHFPDIELLTYAADLSKKNDVSHFAAFVRSKRNKIDVLVNNAGLFLPGAVADEAAGSLESLIETNLYSAYYLTRALLPQMTTFRHGHIFNMCSIASIIAYPNGGSYTIAKFAMLGFSKVLREEMKPLGVKVTAILPGATWTDSWTGIDLPEDRLMQASDIAKLVWGAYDLSDSAVVEEILVRPQLRDL